MSSLRQLFETNQNKLCDKWSLYLDEYQRLFEPRQAEPLRLLEIGIQNGGSLEVWGRFFPHAVDIIGCDIDPRCGALTFDDSRIRVVVADANSDDGMRAIADGGAGFDIVIDDGSHRSSDIVGTFARLLPHLRAGAIYVAEDLHCSYWQEYEGGLADPDSAISFFKALVDLTNRAHWGVPRGPRDWLAGFVERYGLALDESALRRVRALQFVDSMCVVHIGAPGDDDGLGPRIVRGSQAQVDAQPMSVDGRRSRPLPQAGNPWAHRALPSRRSVEHDDETRARLGTAEDLLSASNQALQRSSEQLETLAALRQQELQRHAEELDRLDASRRLLAQSVARSVARLEAVTQRQLSELAQQVEHGRAREAAKDTQLAELRRRCAEVQAAHAAASGALASIHGSAAWRLSAPARAIEARVVQRRMLRTLHDTEMALRETGAFDAAFYLQAHPDVAAAGVDPLRHYVRAGAAEGRKPNDAFDTAYYLRSHPDVAASGINPLLHFVRFGQAEGRLPRAPIPAPRTCAASRPASYRFERVGTIEAEHDVLVYVAYSADGKTTPLHRAAMRRYASQGYAIVLVVNSGDFGRHVDLDARHAVTVMVRENVGFDFGAWAQLANVLGGLDKAHSVSFTNDSIVGPLDAPGMAPLRQTVNGHAAQAVFMTASAEQTVHLQSYFFCLKRAALELGALDVIRLARSFDDKTEVIVNEELHLSARLAALGIGVAAAFPCPRADTEVKNPTIHFWRDLLEAGLPFAKVSLFSAGFVDPDEPELDAWLDPDLRAALHEHLASRSRSRSRSQSVLPRPAAAATAPAKAFTHCSGRFIRSRALQACNPSEAVMPVVQVPIEGAVASADTAQAVFAVVHAFYVDEALRILDDLAALEMRLRILLTTDEQAKATALEQALQERGLRGEVVVVPNRGRDVAPFLIEGAKRLGGEPIVLHLHTKKSVHNGSYADWGSFLRANLVGSAAIAASIVQLLSSEDVGLVYSDHFEAVRHLRNWGFNFGKARDLLQRLGCTLDADMLLDFPTSTMFWARTDAIRPLLQLGLRYEDFDAETGQLDGTLAHAVERCLLYAVEAQGFRHLKVAASAHARAGVLSTSSESIPAMLKKKSPQLLGSHGARSRFHEGVDEVYPVDVAASRSMQPRLNVLVPTLQPSKVGDGVAAALRSAKAIWKAFDDMPAVRIVVTSDKVDAESLDEAVRRSGLDLVLVGPDEDHAAPTLVDLFTRRHEPLSLRADDVFVATAWWTADLAFRLQRRQAAVHGAAPKVIYLVQDYEPGFYAWSNLHALALATYTHGADTVALLHSEELANVVSARHAFAATFHLPYRVDDALASRLVPTVKSRRILAHGRPGVARNLFELLVEGLRLWQGRDPDRHSAFEIVFAGEPFDAALIDELENARCVGTLSLEDHADMLNTAAIGVSLMMSPHPGDPPLEMASAGCITITNTHEGKDLAQRSDRVVSLSAVTPDALADALDQALLRCRFDAPVVPAPVGRVATAVPEVDYRAIVRQAMRGGV